MLRLLAVLALLSTWVSGAHSSPNHSVKVLPDSSNFVTASLVIATPLNNSFSLFGHVALRMECPVHHLDNVFSFEHDGMVNPFQTGIMGKAQGACVLVPFGEYLQHSRAEGRGVTQYELNLTLEEERDLWRRLDEDMMAGRNRHFNLLHDNCLSSSIFRVQQSLQGEYLDWGNVGYPMNLCYGDLARLSMRDFRWIEFAIMTVCGTSYHWQPGTDFLYVPEYMPQMLQDARFVNPETGEGRPVLKGKGQQLSVAQVKTAPSTVSPERVFGSLLLITVLLTMGEWLWNWRRMPHVFDIVLFALQTLMGLLLLYVMVFSDLFGGLWNWYLLVFNPVPFLLWLLFRKKRNYPCVWGLYSVVLLLFILATPFIGVLDVPHQMLTATMLIRSISNYFKK